MNPLAPRSFMSMKTLGQGLTSDGTSGKLPPASGAEQTQLPMMLYDDHSVKLKLSGGLGAGGAGERGERGGLGRGGEGG